QPLRPVYKGSYPTLPCIRRWPSTSGQDCSLSPSLDNKRPPPIGYQVVPQGFPFPFHQHQIRVRSRRSRSPPISQSMQLSLAFLVRRQISPDASAGPVPCPAIVESGSSER